MGVLLPNHGSTLQRGVLVGRPLDRSGLYVWDSGLERGDNRSGYIVSR